MTDLADQPTAAPASLASAIVARLATLHMTRNQLAARMDCRWSTIQRLCDGRTRAPNQITVARLERVLQWPDGWAEAMIPRGVHRGRRPGRHPEPPLPRTWTAPGATPWVETPPPVDPYKPAHVMHLDVPHTTPGPTTLALPDPALRWRSPRNLAGRVQQVERWTYALAVARILVKQAEEGAA